jgi:hypothetical protein
VSDDPYRTSALAVVEPAPLAKRRPDRLRRRLLVWAGLTAIAGAIGVIGGGIAGAMWMADVASIAVIVEAILGATRMMKRPGLFEMPFRIVHGDDRAPYDSPSAQRIDSIVVTLRQGIEPAAMEAAVKQLLAKLPELSITTESTAAELENVITLRDWPSALLGDDRGLLIEVMSSWGVDLDARHGIRDVWVRWKDSVPISI